MGFAPFLSPDEEGDGTELISFGEFKPLRVGGTAGQTLVAGVWKLDEPTTSPLYSSPLGDETFLILEGSVTITDIDSGESATFDRGDMVAWRTGTRTRWEFHSPFRKFLVVGSAAPQPELPG
ncbi:MAG: cupin domain-containing protein [Actinomycetota bacterium]